MEKQKDLRKRYYFAYIVLVVVLILQGIDFLAQKLLSTQINQNFIFGLVSNNVVLMLVSVVIIVVMICVAASRINHFFWPAILIVSGAVSNIISRIIYGGVIDYIKIWFIPTFNVSDVLIILGFVFLGIKIIFKHDQQ